jgi:elongation factor 2
MYPYASKLGVDVDKMMKKLETKKRSKSNEEDNKRLFGIFVLDHIYMVFDAIVNSKKEETAKLLGKLTNTAGKAVKDLLKVFIAEP